MTPETMLLRQIHPSWIQLDRVTSQAFMPTSKDQNLLSVYDGDLIEPEKAWFYHTDTRRLPSVGVMGVKEKECQALGLPTRSEPNDFPEYAVIDFTGLSRKQIKSNAVCLKLAAESHDWLYQAE